MRYNLRLSGFDDKIYKSINELALLKKMFLPMLATVILMQIRPYRTIDNCIDGVVILFTDITAMRKSLDNSREAAGD